MEKCAICQESSSSLYTLGCCVKQFHKACIAQHILNDMDGLCPHCQHKIDKAQIKPIGGAEPTHGTFSLRSSGQMTRNAGKVDQEGKSK